MAKVEYDKDGPVARITLNRPEVKNAIDVEAHELLRGIWADFAADEELRVAVLTGTGDAFCAGADLRTHVPEWDDVGPMLARSKLPDGFAGGITRGQHRIYKPVVAALNGWVLGGGLELALACDIRIASERARFGSFELRRGMHFADGGIVRLVNICGAGIALEMELTGEPIDAERALACNMVSRVVPHEDLAAVTDQVVASILRNDRPGGGVRQGDDPRGHRPAAGRSAEARGAARLRDLRRQSRDTRAVRGVLRAPRRRPCRHQAHRARRTRRRWRPAPGGDRSVYEEEHQLFRQTVRRFVAEEIAPHFDRWEEAGIVDRELWDRAGSAGLLCPQVPESHGGTGDFRYNAVVIEETATPGLPDLPATSPPTATSPSAT